MNNQYTLLSYPWVLLALCLWREARGCSHQEKLAIAHVIANRATDPKGRFPKSIAGVICQPEFVGDVVASETTSITSGLPLQVRACDRFVTVVYVDVALL